MGGVITSIGPATAKVLQVLLSDPGRAWYGRELIRETGIASGSMYPLLRRLEAAGWVISQREVIDAIAAGRPARTYHHIAPQAVAEVRARLVAEVARYTPPPATAGEAGIGMQPGITRKRHSRQQTPPGPLRCPRATGSVPTRERPTLSLLCEVPRLQRVGHHLCALGVDPARRLRAGSVPSHSIWSSLSEVASNEAAGPSSARQAGDGADDCSGG